MNLPNKTSGYDTDKYCVKQEKIIEENNSLKKAFDHLKNNYEDAIAECESQCKVIEEQKKRIEILSKKLSDVEDIKDNIKDCEAKTKLATNDKKNMEAKYDQVFKENKVLKKDICELENQIKNSNKDLKTAINDKRDTNHQFENRISILKNKNETLVEFKTLKDAE